MRQPAGYHLRVERYSEPRLHPLAIQDASSITCVHADECSRPITSGLRPRGLCPSDRVAIVGNIPTPALIAMRGVVQVGAAHLPMRAINPSTPIACCGAPFCLAARSVQLPDLEAPDGPLGSQVRRSGRRCRRSNASPDVVCWLPEEASSKDEVISSCDSTRIDQWLFAQLSRRSCLPPSRGGHLLLPARKRSTC